jgi:hypothetical protein
MACRNADILFWRRPATAQLRQVSSDEGGTASSDVSCRQHQREQAQSGLKSAESAAEPGDGMVLDRQTGQLPIPSTAKWLASVRRCSSRLSVFPGCTENASLNDANARPAS